jgi:hypothetical protein
VCTQHLERRTVCRRNKTDGDYVVEECAEGGRQLRAVWGREGLKMADGVSLFKIQMREGIMKGRYVARKEESVYDGRWKEGRSNAGGRGK